MHAFVNDLERSVGTHLLGRRMYEVMSYWDDPPMLDEQPPVIHDFAAIWRAADKVVFSRTLTAVSAPRTRLERDFDPEAIRRLKASATRDIAIGGPELAARALAASLVDEVHLLLNPIILGGGNPALPAGVRVQLALRSERRFRNGVVHVGYRTM